MKKREPDFTKYPLCLTIDISPNRPTFFSTRSAITSSYPLYNEVGKVEENVSNIDKTGTEDIADYIDYVNLMSKKIIEDANETNFEKEEESDINEESVICNKNEEEIVVSQIYKDKKTLKNVLSHYAIKNNFQYCVQKSCTKEYLVVCLDKNCKWTLRALRNGKTNQFIIKSFQQIHTCALEIRYKDKRQATSTIIGDMIKHKFNDIKTMYKVVDIMNDMKHDHGVKVKYSKAWRSREKAKEKVLGNAAQSYVELPSYLHRFHLTNPGSRVDLKTDDNGIFLYAFVVLNASIKGWPHCIPCVIVDGTFMKSAYGGILLAAATHNGEGKSFPLAYGVVDSENDDSWEFFFDKFRKAYGVREDMIIISDRHESIIKAVNTVYPKVPHGACAYIC
ncbi:hypothetical protein CsatB_026580 [Cannabis sativa]